MKTYFLFAGADYYPAGGMEDFVGYIEAENTLAALSQICDKLEEARRKNPSSYMQFDWYQLYTQSDHHKSLLRASEGTL